MCVCVGGGMREDFFRYIHIKYRIYIYIINIIGYNINILSIDRQQVCQCFVLYYIS